MLTKQAVVREAKRVTLSTMHNAAATAERVRVKDALKRYDASVIKNEPLSGEVTSILFVITRMVRFHGGQTSILRLGTKLSELGVRVGYAVYKPQSKEEMEICAVSNLSGFKGELIDSEGFSKLLSEGTESDKEYQVICASSWDTVSYVKKLGGYKAYFIQDYEPYFYNFGELFLLSQKTYEQGLHMISLGSWNKEMINRNCNTVSKIDVVDFPYESKDYPECSRSYDYRNKKKLTLAVYLKFYGKRLPCIIPEVLNGVKKRFEKRGVQVEILYFGEAKSFKAPYGKNLGMLNKDELNELYKKADFGVVASMSNISLVPYEMLSAGLPVIEAEDGTFNYFFKKPAAIMMGLSSKELYLRMKKAISTEGEISLLMENAREEMRGLSWEKTAKQFKKALEGAANERKN
ncbi:MAG: glycosyltransferase family 1 protein [Lachnospiraceae bacterium]|nr:glycosyltransferase family 1 protein [Lachnospiraceae bacterium]